MSESKTIQIGETSAGERVELDLYKFIQTRGMIQASSGGGKSWLVRVISEQTLKFDIPVWIIDPEGEYTTLREKFDVVILGADDADLPTDETVLSAVLPELFSRSVSCVFDLSELALEEKQRVTAQVCTFLLSVSKAEQKPLLLAVDEAQILAPEREITVSGKALSDIASRGRKRALGLLVATQRLSALNKNLTTQLQNRFVGFCREDIEVARAADLIGKKNAALLPDFEPGDFFAVGGAVNFRHAVRFHSAQVETTHPDASIEDFSKRVAPVASSQLSDLLNALREKLTAETVEPEPQQLWTAEEIERDFKINIQEFNAREEWLEKQEETLNVRERELDRRETEIREKESYLDNFKPLIFQKIESVFAEARELLEVKLNELKAGFDRVLKVPAETLPPAKIEVDLQKNERICKKTSIFTKNESNLQNSHKSSKSNLPPAQQKILNALVTFEQLGLETVDRSNVAVFSGQSPKSSAFDQNLRELRNKGFIESANACVNLTDKGRRLSNSYFSDAISGNQDLLNAWCRYLPAKQAAILRLLVLDYGGSPISRETIAEKTGQSVTSSAFDQNLRELRKLGLVATGKSPNGRPVARATNLLFPFGVKTDE